MNKVSRKDQMVAQASVAKLSARRNPQKKRKAASFIRLQIDKDSVEIPESAFEILLDALQNMANGQVSKLVPLDQQCSTQQAAELLHVSRPYVVRLIEEGMLPHEKVGTHRRLKLKDVLAYRQRMEKTRKQKLSALAKQAQELNMGY